jgi:hypothetical protein
MGFDDIIIIVKVHFKSRGILKIFKFSFSGQNPSFSRALSCDKIVQCEYRRTYETETENWTDKA